MKNPRSICTYVQSDRKTECRILEDRPLVTKLHTENKTLTHVPLAPIVKWADRSSTEKMGTVNTTTDRGENYKTSDMSKYNESQDATKHGVGQDSNHQASSHEVEHIRVERNSQNKEITSHNTASGHHIRVTLHSNILPPDARWKFEVKEKRLDAEANNVSSINLPYMIIYKSFLIPCSAFILVKTTSRTHNRVGPTEKIWERTYKTFKCSFAKIKNMTYQTTPDAYHQFCSLD